MPCAKLKGRQKAFITDKNIQPWLYAVADVLEEVASVFQMFSDVHPESRLCRPIHQWIWSMRFRARRSYHARRRSPIDTARPRLMYEHPELKFEDMAMRSGYSQHHFEFPEMGQRQFCGCGSRPRSGTGSEVTSFAVITDDAKLSIKYPIADYALTPNVAIVDANLVLSNTKAYCTNREVVDALGPFAEAIASTMATPNIQTVWLLRSHPPDIQISAACL